MVFDYYKENPYKKDEARFNTDKYKGASVSDKKILFKLFEKLDLL